MSRVFEDHNMGTLKKEIIRLEKLLNDTYYKKKIKLRQNFGTKNNFVPNIFNWDEISDTFLSQMIL